MGFTHSSNSGISEMSFSILLSFTVADTGISARFTNNIAANTIEYPIFKFRIISPLVFNPRGKATLIYCKHQT
ncbi:hypothetical protein EFE41_01915 [Methanohalophilus portucalensis FDF-1]|uniref:Uncharacterized protein n=1 Tax=Methanohalophilus portucalensis FDF-1 TaxID=523843 RepID=A0A3M9LJB8_9EURY|nr:hypothetical protein EFE41_01915 [Methanohalophilus portucalensis FDF-1]